MGRLDVRIVEARNLPNTELLGTPDPYVMIQCENSQHKTSAASGVNPKWDEVFKFVLADPDSSQLELKLWNKNLVSDDFMGQYKMSLGGLTKGIVKDVWVLLQQCKSNAEIHIRLMAHDFGREPTAAEAAAAGVAGPAAAAAPAPAPAPVYAAPAPAPVYAAPAPQPVYVAPQPQVIYQAPAPQPVYAQPVAFQQPVFQQPVYQQPVAFQAPAPAFNAAPSQQWSDFQPVQFMGRVVRATYGPVGSNNDVTFAVQGLQQRGQNQVFGGIHTAIGDPFPGVPKTFCVWYG